MSEHFSFVTDTYTKKLVTQVASDRGEKSSDFLRRAVLRELARLGYLSARQVKALDK